MTHTTAPTALGDDSLSVFLSIYVEDMIGAAIKMDVDKKQTNKNNDQKKLKPIANFRTL